jgi:hypothetical protein
MGLICIKLKSGLFKLFRSPLIGGKCPELDGVTNETNESDLLFAVILLLLLLLVLVLLGVFLFGIGTIGPSFNKAIIMNIFQEHGCCSIVNLLQHSSPVTAHLIILLMGMLKVMMRAIGSIDIVGHAGPEHHIHSSSRDM